MIDREKKMLAEKYLKANDELQLKIQALLKANVKMLEAKKDYENYKPQVLLNQE